MCESFDSEKRFSVLHKSLSTDTRKNTTLVGGFNPFEKY